MDTNTVITLLTIAVVLLSVVIIALLVTAVVVLMKVQQLLTRIDHITQNVAAASDWLVPSKLLGQVVNLFHR